VGVRDDDAPADFVCVGVGVTDGVCVSVIDGDAVGVMDGLLETDGDPDGDSEIDGVGVGVGDGFSKVRENVNVQQFGHGGLAAPPPGVIQDIQAQHEAAVHEYLRVNSGSLNSWPEPLKKEPTVEIGLDEYGAPSSLGPTPYGYA
jgi:hypothetical protein